MTIVYHSCQQSATVGSNLQIVGDQRCSSSSPAIPSFVMINGSYTLALRQVKYLNNIVEQDHRFIKRLVKPGMGFFSFQTAWQTLRGYEILNMIRKGQMHWVGKEDITDQVVFIASLFGGI